MNLTAKLAGGGDAPPNGSASCLQPSQVAASRKWVAEWLRRCPRPDAVMLACWRAGLTRF